MSNDNPLQDELDSTGASLWNPHGPGRVPLARLTALMLEGANQRVIAYLRSLPEVESATTRSQLIQALEEVQQARANSSERLAASPNRAQRPLPLHPQASPLPSPTISTPPPGSPQITPNGRAIDDAMRQSGSDENLLLGAFVRLPFFFKLLTN